MKILYVTGMCAPIKDILTGKTENEITGTPGFFYPWYKLVKRGHQVDFVILSNFNGRPEIKVDWFSEDNVYANIYDPLTEVPSYKRVFRRIKRFLKLLYFTNKAISENNYDFIYCKSVYEGLAGNIVANFRGVPCGMRSLGTMAYADLKKHGVVGAALRNPFEFLTYRLKKDFFIMTDDGTKGDVIHENFKSRRRKYEYYFWKTGIDIKSIDAIAPDLEIPEHDYLFFAARIDNWKRHDRILKILHQLHLTENYLHLYFAGPTQSQGYVDQLNNLIREYGLNEYVHFLGPIKQDDIKSFAYHAIANPLMYDHSNLGNVFFETFSVGAIIIGLNDGSLDEYLVHGNNGFIVNDENEASMIIEDLIKDKNKIDTIRANAISCAGKKFLSIDDRFDKEVDLIEKVVASRQAKKLL
jgi:glycosyltransferase involved in cell wall biosynthesis